MKPAMFVLLWLGASVAAVLVAWQGVSLVDDAVIHPASHVDLVRSSADAVIAGPIEANAVEGPGADASPTAGVEQADPSSGQRSETTTDSDPEDVFDSDTPVLDLSGEGGAAFPIPTPTAEPTATSATPTPRARSVAPTPDPTPRPAATPRPRSTATPRPSPTPRTETTATPRPTPRATSTPRSGSTATPTTPTPQATATPRPTSTPAPSATPRPTPSPSETETPSPTAAPAQTLTFALAGGTTAISFSSAGVTVLWASPAPGFATDISSASKGVRVEFTADHGDSRIDAWWSDGPQWTIEEDHE